MTKPAAYCADVFVKAAEPFKLTLEEASSTKDAEVTLISALPYKAVPEITALRSAPKELLVEI